MVNLELEKVFRLLVARIEERTEVGYVLADFGYSLCSSRESLVERLVPAISIHRGNLVAINHHARDNCVAICADWKNQVIWAIWVNILSWLFHSWMMATSEIAEYCLSIWKVTLVNVCWVQ